MELFTHGSLKNSQQYSYNRTLISTSVSASLADQPRRQKRPEATITGVIPSAIFVFQYSFMAVLIPRFTFNNPILNSDSLNDTHNSYTSITQTHTNVTYNQKPISPLFTSTRKFYQHSSDKLSPTSNQNSSGCGKLRNDKTHSTISPHHVLPLSTGLAGSHRAHSRTTFKIS